MKTFLKLIAVFVLPALLAACPDGKTNNSSKKTATTPMDTNCLQGQTNCNSQLYGHFPGFFPYPYSYAQYGGYMNYWQYSYGGYYANSAARFCQCGSDALPVYNSQLGLGCIRKEVIAPIYGLASVWNLPAVNGQWTNWTQYSNMEYSNQMSCLNGVTQACFLQNQNEDCPEEQICRRVSYNSPLGVCTQKTK